MSKLTRREAELHKRACDLVAMDRALTEDERLFVLRHWLESETTLSVLDGAFFTPMGLARDMAMHVCGDRVLDLGAGIGRLAHACRATLRPVGGRRWRELVCVERNPEYVAVGRRVVPEATWICADLFDLPALGLDRFGTVLANPPYGLAHRSGRAPRYQGPRPEYEVIDVARGLAKRGVFLIPQVLAPFRYSGRPGYEEQWPADYDRLQAATGIVLEPHAGVNSSDYQDDWRGVSPVVEIVTCDFEELLPVSARPTRGGAAGQLGLWG